MSSPPIDKNADKIQRMFAGVAPRYDFLNHLLSGSLDRLWRRRVVQALNAEAGVSRSPSELSRDGSILDLCCGTGDQAISLRADGRKVLAADFNDIVSGDSIDDCTSANPDPFGFVIQSGGGTLNTRRVEPRNTPTVRWLRKKLPLTNCSRQ